MIEKKEILEIKDEDLKKVNGGTISQSGYDDANLPYKLGDTFQKPDRDGLLWTYEIIDIYKKYNTYYYVLSCIDRSETIDLFMAQIQSSYTKIN